MAIKKMGKLKSYIHYNELGIPIFWDQLVLSFHNSARKRTGFGAPSQPSPGPWMSLVHQVLAHVLKGAIYAEILGLTPVFKGTLWIGFTYPPVIKQSGNWKCTRNLGVKFGTSPMDIVFSSTPCSMKPEGIPYRFPSCSFPIGKVKNHIKRSETNPR